MREQKLSLRHTKEVRWLDEFGVKSEERSFKSRACFRGCDFSTRLGGGHFWKVSADRHQQMLACFRPEMSTVNPCTRSLTMVMNDGGGARMACAIDGQSLMVYSRSSSHVRCEILEQENSLDNHPSPQHQETFSRQSHDRLSSRLTCTPSKWNTKRNRSCLFEHVKHTPGRTPFSAKHVNHGLRKQDLMMITNSPQARQSEKRM